MLTSHISAKQTISPQTNQFYSNRLVGCFRIEIASCISPLISNQSEPFFVRIFNIFFASILFAHIPGALQPKALTSERDVDLKILRHIRSDAGTAKTTYGPDLLAECLVLVHIVHTSSQ